MPLSGGRSVVNSQRHLQGITTTAVSELATRSGAILLGGATETRLRTATTRRARADAGAAGGSLFQQLKPFVQENVCEAHLHPHCQGEAEDDGDSHGVVNNYSLSYFPQAVASIRRIGLPAGGVGLPAVAFL